MRAIIIIASIIALLPAQAIASDQFDLICKGRQKTRAAGSWRPVTERFRIDLAAKRWCRGGCTKVAAIAAVDDARITFMHSSRADSLGAIDFYVDRSTGKLVEYRQNEIFTSQLEGTCESAPFSGLPANKF